MRSVAADATRGALTTSANLRLSALNVFLLGGCLVVALSSLRLPLPGGDTKPLMALAWIPLFAFVAARAVARLRMCLPEFAMIALLIGGLCWLPVVVARGSEGDLPEYVVRMLALTAGISVALVAANLPDKRALSMVVTFVLVGYAFVLAYALLVQAPATFGVDALRQLDIQVREAILNRGKDVRRLTMLADEPSFASFQLGAAVLIAIVFRHLIPRVLFVSIVCGGVLALVAAKSLTAVVMFGAVIAALVASIRRASLRWCVVGASVFAVPVVVLAVVSQVQLSGPLGRIATLEADASANARWLLFKSTWAGGVASNYLGLGPGQYAKRWNEFVDVDPIVLAKLPERLQASVSRDNKIKPFSLLGGLFAEFGTPLFLLFCSTFAWLLWRQWQLRPYPALPAAVAVFGIALSFLSAYPPALPDMWLLLGLLVAHIRLSPRRPRLVAGSPAPRVPAMA